MTSLAIQVFTWEFVFCLVCLIHVALALRVSKIANDCPLSNIKLVWRFWDALFSTRVIDVLTESEVIT